MKNEIEKLKTDFQLWQTEHLDYLPLSAPFWTLNIIKRIEKNNEEIVDHLIELGKYKAAVLRTNPFYKPYSKTFLI